MPPEKVVFMEMDRESQIIARHEFAPDDIPMHFSTGAEYIIAEFTATDGAVTREIAGREDEYLNTFREIENGVCVKQGTEIIWE